MKKLLTIVIMMLVLVAGNAVTGSAQVGGGEQMMARLESELRITDEMIQQVRDVVATDDNPVAATKLAGAQEFQEFAWKQHAELRHQFRTQQYQAAMNATQRARELAKAALGAARQVEQYEGKVLRQLEQAQEMLERARDALAGTNRSGLKALYESAETSLTQARDFYHRQQYRPAFKLARQVQEAARKIINAANTEAQAGATYQRRLETANQVMEQAREMVADCDSESARSLMEQAEQALHQARQLAGENQPGQALKRLKQARDLASRAARQCQGGDMLQQRYERLVAEMERLKAGFGDAPGAGSQTAQRLLTQAQEQLTLARGHLDNQRTEAAVAALRAAQLSLRQANDLLSETGPTSLR